MDDCLSDYHFFDDSEFGETNLAGDDLFALLDSLDGAAYFSPTTDTLDQSITAVMAKETEGGTKLVSSTLETDAAAAEISPKSKKRKISSTVSSTEEANPDGQQRILHITVERNRRKQMNGHLSVLRSLMPCFYVKRGDQASIIGGVVDYITELQQLLQSLEAKKQRKLYSEVLSPKFVSSPRIPPPLSPRKLPLSPRLNNLPISPRTPQPGSPYRPRLQQQQQQPGGSLAPSPTSSSASSSADAVNELSASSKSAVADVEVKFSGANVLVKTVSPRIPGQTAKIVVALEDLSLEILNASINVVADNMVNSFTIKIGIECQLSAEELAQKIQQTFC